MSVSVMNLLAEMERACPYVNPTVEVGRSRLDHKSIRLRWYFRTHDTSDVKVMSIMILPENWDGGWDVIELYLEQAHEKMLDAKGE